MSVCFLGHEFDIVDVLERAGWCVCMCVCVCVCDHVCVGGGGGGVL